MKSMAELLLDRGIRDPVIVARMHAVLKGLDRYAPITDAVVEDAISYVMEPA